MNITKFTELVAQHEGLRLEMYHDTVGVPTIGYGHNMMMPISAEAAKVILDDDIKIVFAELMSVWIGGVICQSQRKWLLHQWYLIWAGLGFLNSKNL